MLKTGTIIGNYEVVSPVAAGGMGVVYRGKHRLLGTDVALKVLLDNMAMNPKIRHRFQQEAHIQAHLKHPGIVHVTDLVSDEENLVIVMDIVDGPSMHEMLAEQRTGPWKESEALRFVGQLAEALAYAHGKGVVHRDLKPANILIDTSQPGRAQPKIVDFGIAKILHSEVGATKTGTMMGSMPYMAPEQARGEKDIGAPADVYALGVILWQLLAGQLPVDPQNTVATLAVYSGQSEFPKIRSLQPGVSPQVAHLLDSMLAFAPSDRLQDAGEIHRTISALGEGAGTQGHAPAPAPPRPTPSAPAPAGPPSVVPPTVFEGGGHDLAQQAATKSRAWIYVTAGLFLVGGLVLALVLSRGGDGKGSKPSGVSSAEEQVKTPLPNASEQQVDSPKVPRMKTATPANAVPQLCPDSPGFKPRRTEWIWSDRCWHHLKETMRFDCARAACLKGLDVSSDSNVRGSLYYNLGLVAKAEGLYPEARSLMLDSLRTRPTGKMSRIVRKKTRDLRWPREFNFTTVVHYRSPDSLSGVGINGVYSVDLNPDSGWGAISKTGYRSSSEKSLRTQNYSGGGTVTWHEAAGSPYEWGELRTTLRGSDGSQEMRLVILPGAEPDVVYGYWHYAGSNWSNSKYKFWGSLIGDGSHMGDRPFLRVESSLSQQPCLVQCVLGRAMNNRRDTYHLGQDSWWREQDESCARQCGM